ncbi:MAG: hypothetical protein U0169_07200 [Polyangiaceae bacterium]
MIPHQNHVPRSVAHTTFASRLAFATCLAATCLATAIGCGGTSTGSEPCGTDDAPKSSSSPTVFEADAGSDVPVVANRDAGTTTVDAEPDAAKSATRAEGWIGLEPRFFGTGTDDAGCARWSAGSAPATDGIRIPKRSSASFQILATNETPSSQWFEIDVEFVQKEGDWDVEYRGDRRTPIEPGKFASEVIRVTPGVDATFARARVFARTDDGRETSLPLTFVAR